MCINFIFGLILAMVIGTIVNYLVIQGADFLARYIRKRNLKDRRIVDFDPDIPAIRMSDEEISDEEAILDARDWCEEDDRIVFIMVKSANKANLVTKNDAFDVTDIYNKFRKEDNNGQEDDDADRTDADNDVDSADEDRQ